MQAVVQAVLQLPQLPQQPQHQHPATTSAPQLSGAPLGRVTGAPPDRELQRRCDEGQESSEAEGPGALWQGQGALDLGRSEGGVPWTVMDPDEWTGRRSMGASKEHWTWGLP